MNSKIVILFIDQDSDEEIGLIEFDPSGKLIIRSIKKGLHHSAMEPVFLVTEQLIVAPLNKKYPMILEKRTEFPDCLLEMEAIRCVSLLNTQEAPLRICGHIVRTKLVSSGVETDACRSLSRLEGWPPPDNLSRPEICKHGCRLTATNVHLNLKPAPRPERS